MHDDMDGVLQSLTSSAELIVVSPVYFAGPPAQFKALLDRLQPFFYSDVRKGEKRIAHLVVVGDGGDPHGFEPLVVCTRSALSVAGFSLQDVTSCIGMTVDEAVDEVGCWMAARYGFAGEGPLLQMRPSDLSFRQIGAHDGRRRG